MTAPDETHVRGFPAIEEPGACVLVLGTMPSRASLAAGRYYAHPRNAFWPIMEEVLAGGPVGGYAERTRLLIGARIALWDVLASTVRPGSLDSSIVAGTERVNDFVSFLAQHPAVHTVFFNGATARDLFERHVAPTLPAERALAKVCLPSTSPANASVSRAHKLDAWRAVARAAQGEAGPQR